MIVCVTKFINKLEKTLAFFYRGTSVIESPRSLVRLFKLIAP